MKKVSETELQSTIEVKLFVTELCPQCAIAINRIKKIAKEIKAINLVIINFSNPNNGCNKYERLAVMPYYLINENFVVPGTSSKAYIINVIKSVKTNA